MLQGVRMSLEYKRIYVEGNEELIKKILELAREKLGKGCNAIDLEPELKEQKK